MFAAVVLYGAPVAVAVLSYLLGCINGAIATSHIFYHDDVRRHGSGNAGLTNFYRNYGAKCAPMVIAFDMLKAVGAPYSPAHIKIDWDRFKETYFRAQTIRSRYTVLDLALECGVLDECVEELFAPGGYWYENKDD